MSPRRRPIVGEQLSLPFGGLFRPPPPPAPPGFVSCAHCHRQITVAEVFIHIDRGQFCADSTCVAAAFRELT